MKTCAFAIAAALCAGAAANTAAEASAWQSFSPCQYLAAAPTQDDAFAAEARRLCAETMAAEFAAMRSAAADVIWYDRSVVRPAPRNHDRQWPAL